MDNLIFFDSEGHSLNFRYNNNRYEGKILFDENSSDTFKTIGLYTFEKINAFQFKDTPNLALDKFQLFNSYGVKFVSSNYFGESIKKVEAVNDDVTFFSKWIYGDGFNTKFIIGSSIRFDSSLFEFNSVNVSYVVVATKPNAIMIISNTDNNTFNTLYLPLVNNTSSYLGKTISGLNLINVNNYIDSTFNPILPQWSEPLFFNKLFNKQKISVVGGLNNGIKTVKSSSLLDNIYKKFTIGNLLNNQDLIIKITLKTDLPLIYTSGLNVNSTLKRIDFLSTIPYYLKPGTQFQILNSINNQNYLTVDSILYFNALTSYVVGDQVIFKNKIFECTTNYSSININVTTPDDITFWSGPTYLKIVETLVNEFISVSQLCLTTNIFYFDTNWDTNKNVTTKSAYNQWSTDIELFNVDVNWTEIDGLSITTLYPSNYIDVNYYSGSTLNDITITKLSYEKQIEVSDILINENNKDISELFEFDVNITDLDDFGLRVFINKQEYYIDTDFSYDGLNVDMEKTIHQTISDFIDTHFNTLILLGIVIEGTYVGIGYSMFFNNIKISTVYPNIPISLVVSVGSTANYFIKNKMVSFNDIGNVLDIVINNKSYYQKYTGTITDTLFEWVSKYDYILREHDIYVTSINNNITFNSKEFNTKIDIIINIGKTSKPTLEPYKIITYKKGNIGLILTSNKVVTSNYLLNGFEDAGFSTGMLSSINNSDYPLNNQEYNIVYLDPDKLILSYQGPFWGNTHSNPTTGFLYWSYNSAFGYDPLSPYNLTPSFVPSYTFSSIGVTNSVDIMFNQLNYSLYAPTNNLIFNVIDENNISSTFSTNNTYNHIKLTTNFYNSRLYQLTTNKVVSVDTVSNTIISTINVLPTSYDMCHNDNNGDTYITNNSSLIKVLDPSDTILTPISTLGNTRNIVCNKSENRIYVSSNLSVLYEISGTTRNVISTIITSGPSTFLFYNKLNSSIYGFDGQFYVLKHSVMTILPGISITSMATLEINTYDNVMYISTDNNLLYTLDTDNNIISISNVSYGTDLAWSSYDHNLYIQSSLNNYVYNTMNNVISATLSLGSTYSTLAYNSNGSIYASSIYGYPLIQISTDIPFIPTPKSIGTYSVINDFYYGKLDPNHSFEDDLLIKTREFIRYPRDNYYDKSEPTVNFRWQWEEDTTPEIFLYDFSGDQLTTKGSLEYIGVKPLDNIRLNKTPNEMKEFVSDSKYQQTVFDSISKRLEYIDSETDISFEPEPMEVFIGFNSEEEGVKHSTLLLFKDENINLIITPTSINNDNVSFTTIITDTDKYARILLNSNSTSFFSDKNLKPGQIIQVNILDNQNLKKQYISYNNGKQFKIRSVNVRELLLDVINDVFIEENNIILNYPNNSMTTYLTTTISVVSKEIGRFEVYGQTEIEDIRYLIELNNYGHQINPEEAYIFKHYDIDEQGIDWSFLNKKRKEMLLVKNDIFNYVGSYKAIINAINYFGYNDLELYEYYKNIDRSKLNYGKLFKVEIPDIFDNTVEGWNEKDYIKIHLPSDVYEETNLFNLTYRITDKEGNFILGYSVQEVIIKLSGLKKWLKSNVIPLTHKILDITGRADFVQTNTITHEIWDVNIININNTITPVVGNITESYALPVNTGSTVYNVVVEFTQQDKLFKPDYFNLNVRTYQIYSEWDVFKLYQVGDLIKYYDNLYVSVLSNNKLNNPRKYLDTPEWSANFEYTYGQISQYSNRYYEYISTNSQPKYKSSDLIVGTLPKDLLTYNSKVYVVSNTLNALDIIDEVNFNIIKTLNINISPIKILFNNVNSNIYVLGISDMVIINTTTDTVLTTISFGGFNTVDDFVITNLGKICVPLNNNTVRIYNSSNLLLVTISTSFMPLNLDNDNNNNRLYVGLSSGSFQLIDTLNDLSLITTPSDYASTGLSILYNNQNDYIYYKDSFGFLSKIKNNTYSNVYPFTITDFKINTITGDIYVSSLGNILVIDKNDNIVSSTILSQNFNIGVDSGNKVIYLSSVTSNDLMIFDTQLLVVHSTISLVDSSQKMIFDTTRSTLYGLIETTNNLFRIELRTNSDIPYNNIDWLDVTEWELVSMKPIQTISEYRDGDNLSQFNFTVDSNIDPFIVIETTSDNGYGQIYNDKKSYTLYISEDASVSIVSTENVVNSNP